MKKEKDEKEAPRKGPKPALVAKRDFHIVCNEDDILIKTGDDLSGVPEKYLENLRTERVI